MKHRVRFGTEAFSPATDKRLWYNDKESLENLAAFARTFFCNNSKGDLCSTHLPHTRTHARTHARTYTHAHAHTVTHIYTHARARAHARTHARARTRTKKTV